MRFRQLRVSSLLLAEEQASVWQCATLQHRHRQVKISCVPLFRMGGQPRTVKVAGCCRLKEPRGNSGGRPQKVSPNSIDC